MHPGELLDLIGPLAAAFGSAAVNREPVSCEVAEAAVQDGVAGAALACVLTHAPDDRLEPKENKT